MTHLHIEPHIPGGKYEPIRVGSVPSAIETVLLADHMATVFTDLLVAPTTPEDMCAALGWRYRLRSIGDQSSTIESLLVPLVEGAFSVVVNSLRSPSIEWQRWLVAHEVGHSFFYSANTPPWRIIPSSEDEEQFCDTFAAILMQSAIVLGPGTDYKTYRKTKG